MRIEPRPLRANKPLIPSIPTTVVDSVSLVNTNGQVVTYPYPTMRLDVANKPTPSPSVIANSYFDYEFGDLENVTILSATIDLTAIESVCQGNSINLYNVGRNWDGSTMTWENQPQGTYVDSCT